MTQKTENLNNPIFIKEIEFIKNIPKMTTPGSTVPLENIFPTKLSENIAEENTSQLVS